MCNQTQIMLNEKAFKTLTEFNNPLHRLRWTWMFILGVRVVTTHVQLQGIYTLRSK